MKKAQVGKLAPNGAYPKPLPEKAEIYGRMFAELGMIPTPEHA
jgi:hypothetical protein